MLRAVVYSTFLIVFIMVVINARWMNDVFVIVLGISAIVSAEIFTRILLRLDKK